MGISSEIVNPKFTALFRDTFGFTEEEYKILLSHFETKYITKKEFYFKAGSVSKAKAYVNKGCLRNFVIDDQGHERILHFAFEDWWETDMDSYYSGNVGTCYIQALEDCELLEISKEDFIFLESKIPKLKQWYSVKMRRNATKSLERITEMKTMSLQSQYEKLMEENPQIFQRVPLQYIASYLNVEPQSLSRLRKRLTKD